MTEHGRAPVPPAGSLSLPEVICQSVLMTPFKLHDLPMTEEDAAYCTRLARKLTGDEAQWLLSSFLRFFSGGRAQAPGAAPGRAPLGGKPPR